MCGSNCIKNERKGKENMNARKATIIREVVLHGIYCRSAYCYTMNENGDIVKCRFGSRKRELFATSDEAKQIKKGALQNA